MRQPVEPRATVDRAGEIFRSTIQQETEMLRWPLLVLSVWWAVAVSSILFHFLTWRFVIPGYRFPDHGTPSLIAASMALVIGSYGAYRRWRGPVVKWPWTVAAALSVIQIGFLIAFLQGPDTAVGKGESDGPAGETPIAITFDIRPRWGAYAALIAAVANLGLTTGLSLLATGRAAEQSGRPASQTDRLDEDRSIRKFTE